MTTVHVVYFTLDLFLFDVVILNKLRTLASSSEQFTSYNVQQLL